MKRAFKIDGSTVDGTLTLSTNNGEVALRYKNSDTLHDILRRGEHVVQRACSIEEVPCQAKLDGQRTPGQFWVQAICRVEQCPFFS